MTSEYKKPFAPVDEILYEMVSREMDNNFAKPGLWMKARSDAQWDEAKAKSIYVEMRVAQLREELHTQAMGAQVAAAEAQRTDAVKKKLRQDPHALEARAGGLSEWDINYLVSPIEASRYLLKHSMKRSRLMLLIDKKKLRHIVSCHGVLWVQDISVKSLFGFF